MSSTDLVLTDEKKEIILSMLKEKKTREEISEVIGIPISEIRKYIKEERREKLLLKAEKISEEFLDLDEKKKSISKTELAVIKEKLVESRFLRETIGKEDYSKRNELTGKDGEEIRIGSITFNAPLPSKDAKKD